MEEIATIHVSVETRDRLVEVAERRGVSVPQLLAEFASSERTRQVFVDERRSWSEALVNPIFVAELDEWEATEPDRFD